MGTPSDGPDREGGAATPFVPADGDLDPTLSVVLPTLNEEHGIRTCLSWIADAVAELDVPTEVIVSDSSTDGTAAATSPLMRFGPTVEAVGH